jgi:hypothetical protein
VASTLPSRSGCEIGEAWRVSEWGYVQSDVLTKLHARRNYTELDATGQENF